VHRTGELYGHFETLEQQKDSAALGMWIFLVTEIMFFTAFIGTYIVMRMGSRGWPTGSICSDGYTTS
jgi:heme/copper-type cytochrome/quinol oxidase subunit 3